MKLARSCALSLSNDPAYVLSFATQESSEEFPAGLFAAAVSGTNEIKLYSKDAFCSQGSLVGHTARITAMKFDLLNSDTLWSSSLDGTLRYWNVKKKDSLTSHVFSENDVGYSAIDINCGGTILAAGMESIDPDQLDEKEYTKSPVTVEFWNINSITGVSPICISKFESIHSDDITRIVFHPKDPRLLITGSTDGLVTVLNIKSQEEDTALIQDEDTALMHTLNTESSVNIMGYFGPSLEFIYVITHIETFTIWKYMDGELLTSIIDLKKRSSECNNIDYVIDCIYHKMSERLFLVGGTQDGRIEILHINLDVIEPYLSLNGGHSSIVRCITYQPQCLLTGAEDGMVCAWMALQGDERTGDDALKVARKSRKEKRKQKKPYKYS